MFVQDLKAQFWKRSNDQNKSFEPKDSTEVLKETYVRPDWKKIDINFLNSYYTQDGNNAAVTGGIGTEQLTDFTQKISISFPTSEKTSWNVDAAYDYYSSASTDNIDNIRSSDSSSDIRSQLNIGIQQQVGESQSVGFRLGTSVEYDYVSLNGGINYSLISKDGNRSLALQAQAFYDTWSLYYPQELRGQVQVATDKRQSYNFSASLNQVISKKTQIALIGEFTYMKGLLSTPFHRVYFQEQEQATIELLPSSRLKIPVAVRMNNHLTDFLVSRLYFRTYWDDWGMTAHTLQVELPFKLSRFIALYPHYRYHTQQGIDHFNAFKEASIEDDFYTSDFDLSTLETHTYGVGLIYGSAHGLFKMKTPFKKRPYFNLESVDLKYSHYDRSTGLTADIISLGLKFSF